MPEIPAHLGGGRELPAPLPKRPAEDVEVKDRVYFIGIQRGGRIRVWNWHPKTESLESLQEHVRNLQIAAPKGTHYIILEYELEAIHEPTSSR